MNEMPSFLKFVYDCACIVATWVNFNAHVLYHSQDL